MSVNRYGDPPVPDPPAALRKLAFEPMLKLPAYRPGRLAVFCDQAPCEIVRLPTLMAAVAVMAASGDPALNVRAPDAAVIGALIAMAPAALSASELPLLQLSASATVILPLCAPPPPVFTVTLALANAFCSVVTDRMELLPFDRKKTFPKRSEER